MTMHVSCATCGDILHSIEPNNLAEVQEIAERETKLHQIAEHGASIGSVSPRSRRARPSQGPAPALFEMDDFFPNQAPPIKHDPSGTIHFYRCGTHQVGVQADAHIIECLKRTCPACGDPLRGWFDADVNHNVINRDPSRTDMCMKQQLLTNHVTSSGRHLDGVSDYISTNCYAVSHKQVSGHPTDGYFRRGAPIECTALEFAEKVYWLTTHGVNADSLYQLQTDAARELVATVNRTYAEQIKEARS